MSHFRSDPFLDPICFSSRRPLRGPCKLHYSLYFLAKSLIDPAKSSFKREIFWRPISFNGYPPSTPRRRLRQPPGDALQHQELLSRRSVLSRGNLQLLSRRIIRNPSWWFLDLRPFRRWWSPWRRSSGRNAALRWTRWGLSFTTMPGSKFVMWMTIWNP